MNKLGKAGVLNMDEPANNVLQYVYAMLQSARADMKDEGYVIGMTLSFEDIDGTEQHLWVELAEDVFNEWKES